MLLYVQRGLTLKYTNFAGTLYLFALSYNKQYTIPLYINKILYFTSYFRLFKYMVSFPRYFTVCITYQLPLVHVHPHALPHTESLKTALSNACTLMSHT